MLIIFRFIVVSTIDFFDYYNAWEKVLLERKDLKVLLLSYEDMKKVINLKLHNVMGSF